MGLFCKRKNKETEPIVDEKKQNEVARYRSLEHQVIKELQLKTLGKIDTDYEYNAFSGEETDNTREITKEEFFGKK